MGKGKKNRLRKRARKLAKSPFVREMAAELASLVLAALAAKVSQTAPAKRTARKIIKPITD